MTGSDVLASAFDSLAANKVRSGLTMLGVVIGVALVIILVSLGESAKTFVDDQMRGIGFGRNGMVKKGEMMGDDLDDLVIVPITTAQDLLDTDKLNAVLVWARRTEDLPLIRERIIEFLSGRHMRKDDFHFHTQEEMISILGTITGTLTAFVSGVAAVSLLVGCIGIVNIMLVSVLERTREIGIRKAVGARHRDIFLQFFGESMVLGLVGGLSGLFSGVGLAALVMVRTGLPVQISGWAVFMALICSLGVGLLAGVYPAMRAARANPIQALRFEN